MPVTAPKKESAAILKCYHCGEDCFDDGIMLSEKNFCCEGCKTVYSILRNKDLCDYYNAGDKPGLNQRVNIRESKFAFLDDPEVECKLTQTIVGNRVHVNFYVPQMHCSSCIWLLERLGRVDESVIESRVNFPAREVSVVYDGSRGKLSGIARSLALIGYEPHISMDATSKSARTYDRARIYKIGVAGFCLGNIMLLSFPEYFGLDDPLGESTFRYVFSYLNLVLGLPVFVYCAAEFFVSAWKGLQQRFLNIDAPIALAILVTFGRSVYEIVTQSGPGYMDSMAGIVFFMLVGRYLQDRTQDALSFDRDYRAYFPLGVSVLEVNDGKTRTEKQIPVSALKPGMRVKIYSHEIIPADGILLGGDAAVDYSFVTGESKAVTPVPGEIIYAGGRQITGAIELEVIKEVSQSYLTGLWNNEAFKQTKESVQTSFVHAVSRYFTYVVLSIAAGSTIYWWLHDSSVAWNALTAILIIACPCTLLLSATFTNGGMLSVLHRAGFYLKNSLVLESIGKADTIVFDKTGTLTLTGVEEITYSGQPLDRHTGSMARTLAMQSAHPLSRAVAGYLARFPMRDIRGFEERKGLGSMAYFGETELRLGSAGFTGAGLSGEGTKVYLTANGRLIGCFAVAQQYRPKLPNVISTLSERYQLALISGDNETDAASFRKLFGRNTDLKFRQSPHDKLAFVKKLQSEGKTVVMVGDGLNDAGALQQADVGIAVTDHVNNFTPGSDAILHGDAFSKLPEILRYAANGKKIIYAGFAFSIIYNIVGLTYAVQGFLSPLIAAIIMPSMAVTIMVVTTGLTRWLGTRTRE